MKRSRFSEGQIIALVKEQVAGMQIADVCRKLGIRPATFYRYKSKFGGSEVSDVGIAEAGARECLAEEPVGGLDAGQRRSQRSGIKKVVMPDAERSVVTHIVNITA